MLECEMTLYFQLAKSHNQDHEIISKRLTSPCLILTSPVHSFMLCPINTILVITITVDKHDNT